MQSGLNLLLLEDCSFCTVKLLRFCPFCAVGRKIFLKGSKNSRQSCLCCHDMLIKFDHFWKSYCGKHHNLNLSGRFWLWMLMCLKRLTSGWQLWAQCFIWDSVIGLLALHLSVTLSASARIICWFDCCQTDCVQFDIMVLINLLGLLAA